MTYRIVFSTMKGAHVSGIPAPAHSSWWLITNVVNTTRMRSWQTLSDAKCPQSMLDFPNSVWKNDIAVEPHAEEVQQADSGHTV